MNYKKLLCLTLITVFIFCLSGCGKTNTNVIPEGTFTFEVNNPQGINSSTVIDTSIDFLKIDKNTEVSNTDFSSDFVIKEEIKEKTDIDNTEDILNVKEKIFNLLNSDSYYLYENLTGSSEKVMYTQLKETQEDFFVLIAGKYSTICTNDFIYYTVDGINWYRISSTYLRDGEIYFNYDLDLDSLNNISNTDGIIAGQLIDNNKNVYYFKYKEESQVFAMTGGNIEKFVFSADTSKVKMFDLPENFSEGDLDYYNEVFGSVIKTEN